MTACQAQFHCTSHTQCVRNGEQGVCESDSFCSFPASSCAGSGRRYGDFAGNVSNTCVPAGAKVLSQSLAISDDADDATIVPNGGIGGTWELDDGDTLTPGISADAPQWAFMRFILTDDIPANANVLDARLNLWMEDGYQWAVDSDALSISFTDAADAPRPADATQSPSNLVGHDLMPDGGFETSTSGFDGSEATRISANPIDGSASLQFTFATGGWGTWWELDAPIGSFAGATSLDLKARVRTEAAGSVSVTLCPFAGASGGRDMGACIQLSNVVGAVNDVAVSLDLGNVTGVQALGVRAWVSDTPSAPLVFTIDDLQLVVSGTPGTEPALAGPVRWPESGGLPLVTPQLATTPSLAAPLSELAQRHGGLSRGAAVVLWVAAAMPTGNSYVIFADSSASGGHGPTFTLSWDLAPR